MASPTGVTLCKRFTNKYVPVVIGLRANNVRPYGYARACGRHSVRRGRTPGHLLLPFGQFTLCRAQRRLTHLCSSNLSVNCEYFTKDTQR